MRKHPNFELLIYIMSPVSRWTWYISYLIKQIFQNWPQNLPTSKIISIPDANALIAHIVAADIYK